MKLFRERYNACGRTYNRFYPNILISLSISIVITIIALSAVLYINFENILLYNIFNSEKHSLYQASFSARTMMESVKTLSYQLYFDDQTSKLSMMPLNSIPVNEFNVGVNTIDKYRLTAPFIQSIYVYNQNAGVFLTSSNTGFNIYKENEFHDKEIINIINEFKSYSTLTPITRYIPVKTSTEQLELKRGYSFLFYDTTGKNTNKLYRAVILNVSEEWLQNTIKNLNYEMNDDTFIIDKNGNVILRPINTLNENVASNKNYIDRILNSTQSADYFTEDIDGVKSLVIYVKYDPLNWFYIRTIPYNMIVEKITALKYKTSSFAGIILICGLIVALFLSKRLYKPIGKALINLGIIEEEWKKNVKVLRNDFLKSIIFGEYEPSFDDAAVKFKQLGIKLKHDEKFVLLLLKIDHYNNFCSDNSMDSRYTLKKNIMKIASEHFNSNFTNESIDIGEEHIVVLINTSNLCNPGFELLEKTIRAFQLEVINKIGISLSITISTVADSLEAVCISFKDALDASYYRVFLGHQCIIYAKEYVSKSTCDYTYPMNKEKALIEALMTGKISEANVLYSEIVGNASDFSYVSYHLTITHLAFSINNAVESIGKINSLSFNYNFMSFLMQLNKLETIQEIDNHFFELFLSISDLLHEKKNSKHDELISKVIDVIKIKYSDYSLSVESIAIDFKISPAYLGRLFKKLTSKSIIDYINELRMEKAKNLLITTSMPVNEIVDRIGFTSVHYFYKVFKKLNSLTPSEYRKQNINISNL